MIVRIIWGAKVIIKNDWGGGDFGHFLVGMKIFCSLFS